MSLEVIEHRGDLRSSREESGEDVSRDLREGEVVTLSIKHVDDLIEAHEIADEWQILAMAGLIRVREGSSDDGAEFTNVTHVNATHTRIERESPAHGSVCLLLRSHGACEVLVEERRDDECIIRKLRVLDYRIDLSLAGKVRNVELAAADRFDVRQRGPDYMFDAGIPGSLHCGGSLFPFVGSFQRRSGDEKYAICPFECSGQGFRAVQICFNDFVGEVAMLVWIASQCAHLESSASLQGTDDCAPLVTCCADYGDQFLTIG